MMMMMTVAKVIMSIDSVPLHVDLVSDVEDDEMITFF